MKMDRLESEATMQLFNIHIHNKKVWFRFNIGKLSITRIGHETRFGIKYPLEIMWNGICIVRIGWYV